MWKIIGDWSEAGFGTPTSTKGKGPNMLNVYRIMLRVYGVQEVVVY